MTRPTIRSTPVSRRAFVSGAAAALLASEARAGIDPQWRPATLDVRELEPGREVDRRVVLGVPRDLRAGERVPLVVLLHGLGETGNARDGAWAWFERYGLGTSYDRMVSSGLRGRLAFACPFTPLLSGGNVASEYARWIATSMVPRVRDQAPVLETTGATAIGGCSLGGRTALDVFLTNPEMFGAWVGVQTAIDVGAAARFGDRLVAASRRVGARDVFIETSSGDPFRPGNAALSGVLARAGMPNTFVELPGPHDQPWLRRSGTLRLLEWLASRAVFVP